MAAMNAASVKVAKDALSSSKSEQLPQDEESSEYFGLQKCRDQPRLIRSSDDTRADEHFV